jgi:hypothetical protein
VRKLISFIILLLFINTSNAQDTLPNFTLVERGNKVIISWVNPFQSIIQLNVQRSFDSLKNFRTIYSAPSPQLPQNGFSENKMPSNRVFYRIFYVFEGGSYFFSRSLKVGDDPRRMDMANAATTKGDRSGFITIQKHDSFYARLSVQRFRPFRDSVLYNTRDTLSVKNDSLVVIYPYQGIENFRPSVYIYAVRDGVNISLPNVSTRRYSIKFFEENGSPLFNINHVKEAPLLLDKSNFFRAGWFVFELYEEDRLKEKSRFYISKDF